MYLDDAISHFLKLPAVTESTPFGPDVLVYKVGEKMFALANPNTVPPQINLKCDPARAEDLRDTYEAIIPGYHMNKRHWNTLILDESLTRELVSELIDHSYHLVLQGMTKKQRELLR